MKLKNLTCGVGINDADYVVQRWDSKTIAGKRVRKLIWSCPFFSRWKLMLTRCYYQKRLDIRPSYEGCIVCEEWLTFSNFKKWMETQDWEGKQLDKDLLCVGNKIYSPDTCVFITSEVNNFILDRKQDRGSHPIGVYFDKKQNKFMANCSVNGKHTYLGSYNTAEEAHQIWRSFKHDLACKLAEKQSDSRVANVLRTKYLLKETNDYLH